MIKMKRFLILTLFFAAYSLSFAQDFPEDFDFPEIEDTFPSDTTGSFLDQTEDDQAPLPKMQELPPIQQTPKQKMGIIVKSTPRGADVYIETATSKRLMGQTPLRIFGPYGVTCEVVVAESGHKTWRQEVTFDHQQTIEAELLPGSKRWPWIAGGVAALGGGIAILLSHDDPPESTPTWPSPPGRP